MKITIALLFVVSFFLCFPQAYAGEDLLSDSLESRSKTKILLTFDDGPDPVTTSLVLNELKKRNVKAAFFILTTPETFPRKIFPHVYEKAETDAGFATVIKEILNGHMIACHWGGTYVSQLELHPPRLLKDAYDSTGDGIIDKVSEPGNALESDLIQCKTRLNEALEKAAFLKESSDESVIQKVDSLHYIRPPVWKYMDRTGTLDARLTYELMGMQMILTDTRLVDGGYPIQGFPQSARMISKIVRGVKDGLNEIVVTMHDSNSRTARDLPGILDRLEMKLKGEKLIRGVDWDYTQNLTEIDEAFKGFLKRGPYK